MNVLAIGAHFDDVEIGCGGTIAKHVRQGDTVSVLVVTTSDYTDLDGVVRRDRATALAEGRAAAGILGYELICGDQPTKEVTFNHGLVALIERAIIERRADLVYTHWDHDVHQDHQAIGLATLAAARKVNRLLMYRSNLYMSTAGFAKNFFVDISGLIDLKISAILEHRTEVEKFGAGWLDFWRKEAENNGLLCGVAYAEAFQLVKYMA